jgi:MFS family permease
MGRNRLLVAQTCFLIIVGKVAERTGKARMFTVGLVAFSIASLLCALSSSLGQLIVFRLVQGLGASMMFSVSTAIVFRTSMPESGERPWDSPVRQSRWEACSVR